MLANAVLACGTFAARNWLFERGVGSVWLAEHVLFCAGVGMALKFFFIRRWNARRIEVRNRSTWLPIMSDVSLAYHVVFSSTDMFVMPVAIIGTLVLS